MMTMALRGRRAAKRSRRHLRRSGSIDEHDGDHPVIRSLRPAAEAPPPGLARETDPGEEAVTADPARLLPMPESRWSASRRSRRATNSTGRLAGWPAGLATDGGLERCTLGSPRTMLGAGAIRVGAVEASSTTSSALTRPPGHQATAPSSRRRR